jgi:hypothetical protein
MTTYYLNGTPIAEDSDIILNGMTYPYSWLEGTSPSVRASLGIEKDSATSTDYNSTYYWGVGNPKPLEDAEAVDVDGNPVYVQVWDPEAVVDGIEQTGAMVDTTTRAINLGLKTMLSRQVKTKTNELLKTTDYLIIRNEVESVEIPTDVSTYRAAVITESNRVVTAIAAVESVDALITVMSSLAWPTFPVTVVVEEELPDPRNLTE